MNLIISFIIVISLIILTLNHPLRIGLILIIQTLITSIIVGYFIRSFLFAYIIIIIILRGALVLFIYIARIARNEKFRISSRLLIIRLITFITVLTYLFLINKNYPLHNTLNSEEIRLIKIFNSSTSKITLIIIIYLLLTIIVVSNIARVNEGPLRIKTNYE